MDNRILACRGGGIIERNGKCIPPCDVDVETTRKLDWYFGTPPITFLEIHDFFKSSLYFSLKSIIFVNWKKMMGGIQKYQPNTTSSVTKRGTVELHNNCRTRTPELELLNDCRTRTPELELLNDCRTRTRFTH